MLKRLLPFDDHEFFLCGPPGFMQALYDGLRDLGVRDARIQAEAFGPSSLRRRPDGQASAPPPPEPAATRASVVFTLTGDAAEWTPSAARCWSLPRARAWRRRSRVAPAIAARCATRMTAGRVTYAEPTAWRPGEGEVLLCCAVPAQDGGDRIELQL